jgi:hypothetical protein
MWTFAIACVLSLGLLSPLTGNAAQEKKEICHQKGNGSYTIITIPEPAWQTHYDHGDVDVITFYIDTDGDGYGTMASTEEGCEQLDGYAEVAGDCNDDDVFVNPGEPEVVDNGIDDDCNTNTPDQPPQAAGCPCEGISNGAVRWASSFDVDSCEVIEWDDTVTVEYRACDASSLDACGNGELRVLGEVRSEHGGHCRLREEPGGVEVIKVVNLEQKRACVRSIMRLAAEDGRACPPSPY